MRTFLVPILLLISAEALCKSVSGIVFIGANGNGSRDKNETGVAGVSVSDQVSVVQSNADGAYRIQNAAGFGFAFISVPSGYKSGKSFYFQLDSNSSDQVVDFPLVRDRKSVV